MASRPARCGINRAGLPKLFRDYDLERWGYDTPGGGIEWVEGTRFPTDHDWDRITIVTLNLDPYSSDGDFRNYRIKAERPLDPYGAWRDDYNGPHKCGRFFKELGPEGYYDLDNLAFQALVDYGLWVADTEGNPSA